MDISVQLSEHITTNLIPLNRLSAIKQKQLLDNAVIETHPVGSYIFKHGDVDDKVYYFLSGKIIMMAADDSSFSIDSSSDQAFYPIGQMQPRQCSAHVIKQTKILKISKPLYDSLLKEDDTDSSIEVDCDESESDGDWMSHLLESGIFANIPPQNIQKIFELFEEITVSEGDSVVNQGDQGDYFYIIKSGRFEVLRRMEKQNKTFKLATLSDGDSFGEESLLGNVPRNASVFAKTKGVVMRISKESFLSLIRDPAIMSLDYEEAKQLIAKGGVWLDIRSPDEHKRNGLDGSLNIPLETLRVQMNKLNVEKDYVVYCNDGTRSAIAAYLLLSKGYCMGHLKGGLLPPEEEQVINQEKTAVDDTNKSVETVTQQKVQVPVAETKVEKRAEEKQLPDKQVEQKPVAVEQIRNKHVEEKHIDDKHTNEIDDLEANIQNILTQQDDKNELARAMRTVMADMFIQLEQALKEKAKAELARELAEKKLEALQMRIKKTGSSPRTANRGIH